MNQSSKKGFAALYDLQERKRQAKNDSPPLPTTPQDEPPPVTTTPHQLPPLTTTPQEKSPVVQEAPPSHAPARDFNRRANSLEREAMPQGLFPGASKKIYDALYLRTRGANPPRQRVRASRRDFLDWTDIRNLKTVDNNIRLLMSVGLIIRHWELGSNEGSEYEVRLPEELPPLPTTPHHSPPLPTSQKTSSGNTQLLGSGGDSQTIDLQAPSDDPKTFKTRIEKTDDEAFAKLRALERQLTGKNSSSTAQWDELFDVLAAELKIAAARTTSISSVPAFLSEHLRRRLWKLDKKQAAEQGRELPDQSPTTQPDAKGCASCGGSGWWYPEGVDKGVAKCKHRSPVEAEKDTKASD